MPPTPVDDHTEEFEQLAGLSALHLLEGDELARFELHAAQCERCRVMVGLDREALSRLSVAAPEMDPSPDFKARLMQRAAQELAEQAQRPDQPREAPEPAAQPIPFRPAARPPNVVLLWHRSRWASALAAVLVVGLVSAGVLSYENQVVATYDLSGSVPGRASVVIRRNGGAELDMRGVPDPEPGFLYEAWVIPPDQPPIPVGTTSTGDATVPLPGDVAGATIALTRERSRVNAPTSAPFLAAVVRG